MTFSDDLTSALDEATQEFYRRHRGGSGNVILAMVVDEDGHDHFGVFSTIEKANAWCERFEGGNSVCAPLVVDEPDYGNTEYLQ